MFLGIVFAATVFLILIIHIMLADSKITDIAKNILAIVFGISSVLVSVIAIRQFDLCDSIGILLATLALTSIYLSMSKNGDVFEKIFLGITLLYLVFGIVYFVYSFEDFKSTIHDVDTLSIIFGIAIYLFAVAFANLISTSGGDRDQLNKFFATLVMVAVVALIYSTPQLACNSCTSGGDNDGEYYDGSSSSSGKCQFSGGCSREATSGAFCSYHKAYLDDAYEDVYNTLESMR